MWNGLGDDDGMCRPDFGSAVYYSTRVPVTDDCVAAEAMRLSLALKPDQGKHDPPVQLSADDDWGLIIGGHSIAASYA